MNKIYWVIRDPASGDAEQAERVTLKETANERAQEWHEQTGDTIYVCEQVKVIA